MAASCKLSRPQACFGLSQQPTSAHAPSQHQLLDKSLSMSNPAQYSRLTACKAQINHGVKDAAVASILAAVNKDVWCVPAVLLNRLDHADPAKDMLIAQDYKAIHYLTAHILASIQSLDAQVHGQQPSRDPRASLVFMAEHTPQKNLLEGLTQQLEFKIPAAAQTHLIANLDFAHNETTHSAQAVSLWPVFESIMTAELEKCHGSLLMSQLMDIHLQASHEQLAGLIDAPTFAALRTEINTNALKLLQVQMAQMDIKKTQSQAIVALLPDILTRQVHERLDTQFQSLRAKTNSISWQRPFEAQPLVAPASWDALDDQWFTPAMLAGIKAFDQQLPVYLATANNDHWQAINITTADSPLAFFKPNTTEPQIIQALKSYTGTLFTKSEQTALNNLVLAEVNGNKVNGSKADTPHVISLADTQNELHQRFWTSVVYDSRLVPMHDMITHMRNNFFNFSDDTRASLFACYTKEFQAVVHDHFMQAQQPVLLTSNDRFTQLSKRIAIGFAGIGRNEIGNNSYVLRKLIEDELGKSQLRWT